MNKKLLLSKIKRVQKALKAKDRVITEKMIEQVRKELVL